MRGQGPKDPAVGRLRGPHEQETAAAARSTDADLDQAAPFPWTDRERMAALAQGRSSSGQPKVTGPLGVSTVNENPAGPSVSARSVPRVLSTGRISSGSGAVAVSSSR